MTETAYRVLLDYEGASHGRFHSTFVEWQAEYPKLKDAGLIAPTEGSVLSRITDAGRKALQDYRASAEKGRAT